MGPLPRHIHNPATGGRITFFTSPLAGEGAMLAYRCTLPSHAIGARRIVDDAATEIVEVEQGMLRIELRDGTVVTLGAGEQIRIAPGTAHGFSNPGDRPTAFVTTATPGEGLEAFLRAAYTLAANERRDACATRRDAWALALLPDARALATVAVPHPLQRLADTALQGIARLIGDDGRVARMARAS